MSDTSPKFICDLPWVHLSVFPHGITSVCCESNHVNAISHSYDVVGGNKSMIGMNKHSINEIVNCGSYKQIRVDMLEGRIPPACVGCKMVEDNGGVSKRMRDSIWNIDKTTLTSSDGTISPNLKSIELRLGNVCNLKCRSCNAESSSLWVKDYRALVDTVPLASAYDSIIDQPDYSFDWVFNDTTYDELDKYLANVEEIHISGGEPFLAPKHIKILDTLRGLGKTDVRIGYHTNLNYEIERVRPILDQLGEFTNVRLNMSIDDVGDRNTYIRHPSNWDRTISNLRHINQNYPQFFTLVCQTVSVYNFLYIEELHEFFKSEGLGMYHYLNAVHSPPYLSPLIIDPVTRRKKLEDIRSSMDPRLWDDLSGWYGGNNWDYEQVGDFYNFTNAVDKLRDENFTNEFDKLHQALTGANK